MLIDKTYTRNHFKETEQLVKQISSRDIALWILNQGYFPEQYVLPPSFQVSNFQLNPEPYHKKLDRLKRKQLINISYPKTALTSRTFGIQHPKIYHDIVFNIEKNWNHIVEHLFHKDNKVHSYSFPISLTKDRKQHISKLRSGRMIYEWLAMAERDLVLDAKQYQFIVRTDITNFYPSVYTHSIPWALHGRENAVKNPDLYGNKLDKLIQYANDGRTNGIPVGSVLSDLIAEIILARVDTETSKELSKIDFLAVRFKDDYRFLCNSESDAKHILTKLSNKLSRYNLHINEKKTSIHKLPNGLYRKHDREYFPHSLKEKEQISYKCFEHTLLIAIDVHHKYPGTSILEKFISECFIVDKCIREKRLKIIFSKNTRKKQRQVRQAISLLFFAKRDSEKLLCHVLSVTEQLCIDSRYFDNKLRQYVKDTIKDEIRRSASKDSVFEIVWLIFFSRHLRLGINKNEINSLIANLKSKDNYFCKCVMNSKQEFFKDTQDMGVALFQSPRKLAKENPNFTLARYLDVFERN